jgi:queuine tRNA-ribosyltransferase
MLWGINQGGTYADIRIDHMKRIADLDLPGYAIGGLAVGETAQEMYDIIDAVEPYMPANKTRYLMGVGTPQNILEGIERGVDMFDCVMPTRNGRNAMLFTYNGTMNMRNKKWEMDFSPIDHGGCETDRIYTKAYLHHLFKAQELLAMQIASIHNLAFYLRLVTDARQHIEQGDFVAWKRSIIDQLGRRI